MFVNPPRRARTPIRALRPGLGALCGSAIAVAAVGCGDGASSDGAPSDSTPSAAAPAGTGAMTASNASAGAGESAPTPSMQDSTSALADAADSQSGVCDVGAECSETNGCCQGLVCVTLTQGEVTTQTCEPSCTSGDECDTGCCADLGSGNRACLPVSACPEEFCSDIGGVCGEVDAFCCDGGVCTNVNGGEFSCRPECSDDTDCPTGCCRPAGEASACFDAQFCQ